jgi:hypothetical protein
VKTPLKITCYSLSNGKVELQESKSFSVMINPAALKHEQEISYDDKDTLGQPAAEPKFNAIGPDKLSFDIVLDGTGVVPPVSPEAEPPGNVMDLLQKLRSVVYAYDGAKHEPSRVRLLWGTLIFFGRLRTMTTDYTLFKPSGDPLRAKVAMSFVGTMSKDKMALVSNRSSPDLNHRVVVREGDSLPLMCHAIYGDSSYYPEVARHNGLVQFRQLAPGLVLDFPPLQ